MPPRHVTVLHNQRWMRTQIWLVTHSQRLAEAIEREGGNTPRKVTKQDGATWIEGLKLTGEFNDETD